MNSPFYQFSAELSSGEKISMGQYKNQVLLIVNTASKCGFTNQYEGLEKLFKELGPRGFTVLAFPCNQFGHQEPGSDQEISSFCQLNYQTSFPLFSKVEVNGTNAHPLWAWLKKEKPGLLGSEAIKWNFTKFLIDREGRVQERFAPQDTPDSIRNSIEKLL